MTHNLSEPDNGTGNDDGRSQRALMTHEPTPASYALNVILGFGLLGALLVSIWTFGGFTANRQTELLTTKHGLNFRLFSGISILAQGKMIALVAIAFGAGIVMFFQRKNISGRLSNGDRFVRRQLWLIVLGILNGIVFLWTEDVLFHFGIMGILLLPFFRLSSKALLIASLVTALIFSAKHYWNFSDDRGSFKKYVAVIAAEKKIKEDSIKRAGIKDSLAAKTFAAVKTDTLTKKQKDEKAAWEGIVAGKKFDPKKDEAAFKAMRAYQYGKLYNHLMGATQAREAQWTYRFGIWDLSSMIFLGMALFGFGFFSSRFNNGQYFLIAVGGIGAALLLGWHRFYFHIEALRDYQKFAASHYLPYDVFFAFEQWFMALGYAGGIMGIISAGWLKVVLRSLNAVGRMAVTNYIMQSIICGLFFTGFGMGNFGRLQQYQLYFVVLEIWIFQIIFSVLWLRRYEEGPVEWVWRCLTYGAILPIRRKTNNQITAESPLADL